MNDDLQRLKSLRASVGEANDTEEEQLPGIFGWLRGAKEKSAMLELRLKSGNSVAYSYGWLEKADYDPSSGITLQFGANLIQIKGQKLNAEVRPNVTLFEGLLRHRVTWIQETGQAQSLASQSLITVTNIVLK